MDLRGGRRDVEPPGAPPVAETVGEGVGDDILERSQATWFQDQNTTILGAKQHNI